MNSIGWAPDKKNRKIYLVGEKREAAQLRKVVFEKLEIPDRVNFLFDKGDFGSICVITCFSGVDFRRMRYQLKKCI